MKKLNCLRWVITIGAVILAFLHMIYPNLSIDMITLALVLIAILPWLQPLIKSVELPGGFKVEMQELNNATEKAEAAGLLAKQPLRQNMALSFISVAQTDPILALAGLRIEIEKRLRGISETHGIPDKKLGVRRLTVQLGEHSVLTPQQISILNDLIVLLNNAVHGGDVPPEAAKWAIEIGPRLLASLDEHLKA